MHKAGALVHASHTPPQGGGLRAADTYREDITAIRCHRQDAPDILSVQDICPTYVLKTGYPQGFPQTT